MLAITPGPDMALQLSRTDQLRPRRTALVTCLGAMCGMLVHTTLVALGISVLIVAAPPLFLALKIVGAVYLLWLAWQAMRAWRRLPHRRGAPSRRRPCGRAFWPA